MTWTFEEIIDTVRMTEVEHFDIRTVTMGINLKDCTTEDYGRLKDNIYDKICKYAENHVKSAREIEKKFGISIANKRISVTPVSIIADRFGTDEFIGIAQTLDKAADTVGVDFLAGFSALVQKGFSKGELNLINAIPRALATTNHVCSSVNVASTKAGINMNAVRLMGEIIKATAEETADRDGLGCAKLVVFSNAVEDNPFVAGAFHGVTEPEVVLNVGISGPGVVLRAIQGKEDLPLHEIAELIK
jgi:uncharacterized protein (UPF0210 family)